LANVAIALSDPNAVLKSGAAHRVSETSKGETPAAPPPNAGTCSAADYARIVPALTVVPLKLKEILHKPGGRIQYVYFPRGSCSMLATLEDGGMVEVATIGREGMVGTSAVLDGNSANAVTMVQGESDICYRMPGDALRDGSTRGIL
jgi:hypothetical protein